MPQKFSTYSMVIPGKLGEASATRNAEFQRHLDTGFRRYDGYYVNDSFNEISDTGHYGIRI